MRVLMEGTGQGMAAEPVASYEPETVVAYSAAAAARNEEEGGGSGGAGGMMSMGFSSGKKRGRPRKYDRDSSNMALALNPISASSPGPFSSKRSRGRPRGSGNKPRLAALGRWIGHSAGGGFTPHVITIAAGEDITMKIMSFSQKGPRAICVLSANGAISNVTLRQPDSSGGTLTYEGRFEILSLSGSFMLTENGGTRSRTGGLSVSLASPDGRVVGGGVAGLLTAATPVQIVIGSFMPSNQEQHINKKPKLETTQRVTSVAPTAAAIPVSSSTMGEPYDEQGPSLSANQPQKLMTSYSADGWNAVHSLPESRYSTDIKSLHKG